MLRIFVFTIFTLLSINLHSQTIYNLRQCIDIAQANNLNIANTELNADRAALALKSSKHQQYPTLAGRTNASINFGRSIDPTSNQFIATNFLSNNYSLDGGVMLFNGFAIQNGIKKSKYDQQNAKLTADQMRRDISLQVATTYLNTLFAKENLIIAKNNLVLTNQQVEQTKKLISAGLRAENDILDFNVQLARNQQTVLTAENTVIQGLISLKQLMLVDMATDIDVEVIDPKSFATMDIDNLQLEEVFAIAKANQPSILAAEASINSAELAVKIAEAQQMPSVNLGYTFGTNISNQGKEITGYTQSRVNQTVYLNNTAVEIGQDVQVPTIATKSFGSQFKDNLSYGFGIGVSVPIYNNYRAKIGVEQSKLDQKSAQNTYTLQVTNLRNTIQKALFEAKLAKATMKANETTLTAQEAAYKNADKKYQLGTLNSFELSNQKNNYDNAKLNHLVSVYDYVFKVKVLEFYMGRPL